MIFHPATEAVKVAGGFRPTLLTDNHDEETERLTGLGARLVSSAYYAPIRLSVFAGPEDNAFNLATPGPSSCQVRVLAEPRTGEAVPELASHWPATGPQRYGHITVERS